MLLTLLSLHFPDHQVFIAVSAIPLSYRIGMNTCDAEPHLLIQNSTAIIAIDELQLQLCNFLTLLRDANHFLEHFCSNAKVPIVLQQRDANGSPVPRLDSVIKRNLAVSCDLSIHNADDERLILRLVFLCF